MSLSLVPRENGQSVSATTPLILFSPIISSEKKKKTVYAETVQKQLVHNGKVVCIQLIFTQIIIVTLDKTYKTTIRRYWRGNKSRQTLEILSLKEKNWTGKNPCSNRFSECECTQSVQQLGSWNSSRKLQFYWL